MNELIGNALGIVALGVALAVVGFLSTGMFHQMARAVTYAAF